MSESIKKISWSLLTAIFISVVLFGSVSFVIPAQAVPVEIVASVPDTTKEVKLSFDQLLKTAVLNASLQAMSYFARKFAYDSAVWLSSGGKGQNPFAHTSSFGDYISQTADNAVGAAIDALGSPFGLNLCKIPDARLDLVLRLSLPNLYGLKADANGEYPPKPNCSFSDFQKNWTVKNFNSMYGSENIADRFNADFQTSQTGLGIFISATAKIDDLRAQEVYDKEQQRLEDQGAKGFVGLISNKISTPGQVMMEEIKAQSPSEGKKNTDQQINSAFSAGVYQILPSTLSVFLNTLASQMLNNYMTKGMFPFGIGYDEGGGGGGSDYAAQNSSGGFTGRRLAQEFYNEYMVASVKSIENYPILAHFNACPPNNPAPDNCVANQELVTALQEGTYGNPVTIGEALDRDILTGSWQLISPLREAENKDPQCFEKAYCYRNVQMLRKARIMPLGFEIAAYLSDPDKPWTLEEVVKGYNECDFQVDGNGNVIGVNFDPAGHPFCHLIDPNWILKLPDTKCSAMAIGSSLLSSGLPNRREECVDMSSCVQYENGKCIAYGYCTKERNLSTFTTRTCAEQDNSCRVFTNTATGEQSSYLYRTLDTGTCDASTVGCRGYSLSKYGDGSVWFPPTVSLIDQDNAMIQIPAFINTGIYLNKNVSTNCSAESVGCTAFNFANNPEGRGDLYLRKAPDYLKCYDSTPGTAVLDWPQNESDLSALQPKADCSRYAKPCIPAEVNCNWYTPVNSAGSLLTSEKIPGKYTIGTDECNAKCVGYDAYRELSSNFSIGQDLAYIIPQSGRTCTAAEEGCSGFTNLSTTAGGLEQVDYFSFLRSCILPDETKQKTFYTYEGSIINGYQLQVYELEKDIVDANLPGSSDPGPNGQTGGPKYFYKTASELATYKAQCNEQQYRLGASPDCRQFNDAKGQVYYRLLSQTVAVSPQCAPYRLNETALAPLPASVDAVACAGLKGRWGENNVCEVCLQNGEFRADDGRCYYYGLPAGVKLSSGESTSCSATVNTCRKYKGNRANDIEVSLFADFDETNKTLTEWLVPAQKGSAILSLESTHLGQHSLLYNMITPVGEINRNNLDLNPGESYELSFWAKGDTNKLSIYLQNDGLSSLGEVSITNVWKNYRLGSGKMLLGTTTSTALRFVTQLSGASSGRLFLDNIRLVRLNDVKYLVKNSLKVDSICDSTPDDNFPGEALGCTEYRTTKGDPKYLTNFSYLCREGAIGCTALLDTRNTLDTTTSTVYNLWVPKDRMADMKQLLQTDKDPCTVPTGNTGCYVANPILGKSPDSLVAQGGQFKSSTIYIPADTATSSPAYLVSSETERFDCNASAIGCVEAGAQVSSVKGWEYVTTTIQNNPAQYVDSSQSSKGVLCLGEQQGCSAFNSKLGNAYFKDPKLLANQRICSYNNGDTAVNDSGIRFTGWFWKGVGKCSNAAGIATGINCTTNVDCGANNTCVGIDTIPCYPTYQQQGLAYGLWSYGTPGGKYTGYVGECKPENDSCKEFVDHDDNNRSYYLIADEKLTQGDCDNGVSRKYGCILLDDTSLPNKFWNSTKTYESSKNQGYKKVKPESFSQYNQPNDSNLLVKVTRDRECAEWLYPSQIHPNSEGVNKTYGLGVCSEAQSGTGFVSQCAKDVTATWDGKGEFLSAEKYVERPTTWNDPEYSGASIFNSYQMADLTAVINPAKPGEFNLVFESKCTRVANSNKCLPVAGGCFGVVAVDGTQRCGTDNNRDGSMDGWCVKQQCVYPARGVSARQARNLFGVDQKLENLVCRGYPELDSPFPKTVLTSPEGQLPMSYIPGFENTKVCSGNQCECTYKKVSYGPAGEVVRYYGASKAVDTVLPSVPNPYSTDEAKLPDYNQRTIAQFNGWWGYCVERDMRGIIGGTNKNACLTWLPIDIVTGGDDIFSKDSNAAFEDVSGDRYVCLRNAPLVPDINRNTLMVHPIEANQAALAWTDFAWSTPDNQDKLNLATGSENFVHNDYGPTMRVLGLKNNTMVVGDRIDKLVNNVPLVAPQQSIIQMDADNDRLERFISLKKSNIYLDNSSGYIDINELSQIDVYMDKANHYDQTEHGRIWIFNKEAIETNACGRDPVDGKGALFNNNNNCLKIDPALPLQWDSVFKTGEQNELYYWEWQMRSLLDNDRNFDWISRLTGNGIYEQMKIRPNEDLTASQHSPDGSPEGLAMRVVFEKINNGNGEEKKLKGIWLVVNEPDRADEVWAGFFLVLHFNNGKCQEIAQISQANSEYSSKPVAWMMKKDKVMFPSYSAGGWKEYFDGNIQRLPVIGGAFREPRDNSVVIRRLDKTVFDTYGLIKGGISPNDLATPILVDPFDINHLPADPEEFTKSPSAVFTGGTPLSTFTFGSSAIYKDITTCATNKTWRDRDASEKPIPANYNDVDVAYSSACLMLERMFGKVYNVFTWDGNKYTAVQNKTFDAASPVNAVPKGNDTKPYKYYVPKIASVDNWSCANPRESKTGCGLAKFDRFSVNDVDNEDVYMANNSPVNIKFFAWADAAQMPLRRFKVDFDNGTFPYVSNADAQSNFKAHCDEADQHCSGDENIPCIAEAGAVEDECTKLNKGTCMVNGAGIAGVRASFGSTNDTGCKQEYYQVYGQYSCDVSELVVPGTDRAVWTIVDILPGQPNAPDPDNRYGSTGGGHLAVMRANPAANKPWEVRLTENAKKKGLVEGTVVCAYNPKVQVMDNWGWCSGRCQKTYINGVFSGAVSEGCYNDWYDVVDGVTFQCDQIVDQNAWVPFYNTVLNLKTSVIVIP